LIRFTGYGVIAEKPRVGQLGHFFRVPCRKNYALDRKMFRTIFNGLDELYHHAKFGEIEQRAPAADAKTWCLYVFNFLSRSEADALFVRGVHSLHRHCVAVYRRISTRFSDFFLKDGSFLLLGGATSFT